MSQSTRSLLTDVFGDDELFTDLHPIRKRIVAWGRNADPVIVPHQALAVSEGILLDRLWTKIVDTTAVPAPDWRIVSTPQGDLPAVDHHFGARIASATSVRLRPGADEEACWVESTESGWLFLLSSGERAGTLITVGESLLESRLVAHQIESFDDNTSRFPAYPRMLSPLCGPGWLACGTAAMSFDPVCGEGAGNAVREAILASAAIRAAVSGAELKAILNHYSTRLAAGMLRHIQLCFDFYKVARAGSWWDSELTLLADGLTWATGQASQALAPRYRLIGFELQPLNG